MCARSSAKSAKWSIGQTYLVERLVIGLLANGHVLLEGVPGLAKTLSVKALALPSTSVLPHPVHPGPAAGGFDRHANLQSANRGLHHARGPIFANLVLADEINRAPAKVQSALLEAMQEKQVTIGDQTFKLEEPFLVLATQNPIEQEGTYPLPEAQVDRFMLKLKIVYPSREEERQILDFMARTTVPAGGQPVVSPKKSCRPARCINDIYIDDKVKDYIVDIVCCTRDPAAYSIEGLQGVHPTGRLTPRHDRADPGGQGLRVPARARLRHAAGRQEHRHGRAAPPGDGDLRGGGGREDQRDGGHQDIQRAARAVRAECQRMIPREILKKIRQIELRTTRLVTETLGGQYHSVFKGQGMNFEEVREYQPGDEVRSIDWNVTARMNHPFIKKFVEERELTLMLVVDLSGSGMFGSGEQSKRELAAEIASVLAFSAIRNNDKVGLILFTEEVEKYHPAQEGTPPRPAGHPRNPLFPTGQRGTNFSEALDVLNRLARRHAIVVVISDFLFEQRATAQESRTRPRPGLFAFADAGAAHAAGVAPDQPPARRHRHPGGGPF